MKFRLQTVLILLLVGIYISQCEIIRSISTTDIATKVTLATISAKEFEGKISIKMAEGEGDEGQFLVTIWQCLQESDYLQCYEGYVNSYTTYQNEQEKKTTTIGYDPKDEEKAQPFFRCQANSDDDRQVLLNNETLPIEQQIIELVCQEINSAFIKAEKQVEVPKLQLRVPLTLAPRTLQEQEGQLSRYQVLDIKSEEVSEKVPEQYRSYGSRFVNINEKIILPDLEVSKSELREDIVIADDDSIGRRDISYNLVLKSDKDQRTASDQSKQIEFDADIQVHFVEVGKKNIYQYIAESIVKVINSYNEDEEKTPVFLAIKAQTLNIARFYPSDSFVSFVEVDKGPQPGDADSENFTNQKSTGVDVVEELEKAKPKPPITTIDTLTFNPAPKTTTTEIEPATREIVPRRATRLLQGILQKYTIINYTKTLFSKTILGKKVEVKFKAFCELRVYSFDHKVHCNGRAIFNVFGKTKTIYLFSWTKSVIYTWNYYKSYPGQWDFKLWIGLPKPVNFIGLSFKIKLSYNLILQAEAKVTDLSPYTYQVKAEASAYLNTDSEAAVRVLAVQGGVYLKGTLVSGKTDPTAIAKYYFSQQKIVLQAKWKAYLNTFQATWGFFWRRWRLFGGWTGRKIIKSWKLKQNKYEWWLLNWSKTINL